jgi:hypothetical protein
MEHRTPSSVRRLGRWALLPAIAVGALLTALPAASARDQQATGAQLDNDANWRAATGNYGGYASAYGGGDRAYDEAPRDSRVRAPAHRDYRYDRDDR